MTQVFGRGYSDLYDAIYAEKDYIAECDALEGFFTASSRGRVKSILDLGCGTGNHAHELSRRGFAPVGVDRSDAMVKVARGKGVGGTGPEFVVGDIRHVDLGREFDAVVSMFAVIGYQTSDEDLRATLGNARRHLPPGGIFVFDIWHGPAVEKVGPSDRFRVIPTAGGELIRASRGELRAQDRCCLVHIQAWDIDGDRVRSRTDEEHLMRYFFPEEISRVLSEAGFPQASIMGWPDTVSAPSVDTWNVVVVATAG